MNNLRSPVLIAFHFGNACVNHNALARLVLQCENVLRFNSRKRQRNAVRVSCVVNGFVCLFGDCKSSFCKPKQFRRSIKVFGFAAQREIFGAKFAAINNSASCVVNVFVIDTRQCIGAQCSTRNADFCCALPADSCKNSIIIINIGFFVVGCSAHFARWDQMKRRASCIPVIVIGQNFRCKNIFKPTL